MGSRRSAEDNFLDIDIRNLEATLKLGREELEKLEEYEQLHSKQWFAEVKRLKAGSSFGELALQMSEKSSKPLARAATIQAVTDCYFAILGRGDYQRFLLKLEQKEHQK